MRDWLMTRAYVHARETGRPSPKWESAMARNGEASYLYALRVLRGRFRKGEPAISADPVWAVRYARFVVRGRFPMAEANIAMRPESCYEYFKHVMRGKRLPDEMHRTMLLKSFECPEDPFIKRYLSEAR